MNSIQKPTIFYGLIDNSGDNQIDKNEKAANFTPLFEKVVGPPGLEPGTP